MRKINNDVVVEPGSSLDVQRRSGTEISPIQGVEAIGVCRDETRRQERDELKNNQNLM